MYAGCGLSPGGCFLLYSVGCVDPRRSGARLFTMMEEVFGGRKAGNPPNDCRQETRIARRLDFGRLDTLISLPGLQIR